jgi:selenide,water dikinase
VDFFTPVVDDPYTFGAIAAANALSDVFAMGGQPITAMNIVAFPRCLDIDILTQILRGGSHKVHEAGAVVAGGHSIEDDEPKYGMAITGTVHPDNLITTRNCQVGDKLIMTKALGSGILTTALKAEIVTEKELESAIAGMARLNKYAAEVMLKVGVHACTDITGFGLLGHCSEMAVASRVEIRIEASALPAYPGAADMAAVGLIPEGSYRNRQHYTANLGNAEELDPFALDLLCDPQTSGGLLMAVPPHAAETLLNSLGEAGEVATLIGEITRADVSAGQVVVV